IELGAGQGTTQSTRRSSPRSEPAFCAASRIPLSSREQVTKRVGFGELEAPEPPKTRRGRRLTDAGSLLSSPHLQKGCEIPRSTADRSGLAAFQGREDRTNLAIRGRRSSMSFLASCRMMIASPAHREWEKVLRSLRGSLTVNVKEQVPTGPPTSGARSVSFES